MSAIVVQRGQRSGGELILVHEASWPPGKVEHNSGTKSFRTWIDVFKENRLASAKSSAYTAGGLGAD
jgi:hypothetical protein